jgi:hypothetical protein
MEKDDGLRIRLVRKKGKKLDEQMEKWRNRKKT